MEDIEPLVFKDKEKKYTDWVKKNRDGFVLNTNKYSFSKIHRAKCYTIKKYTKNRLSFTSNGVYKVCSIDKSSLIDYWYKQKKGDLGEDCRICRP